MKFGINIIASVFATAILLCGNVIVQSCKANPLLLPSIGLFGFLLGLIRYCPKKTSWLLQNPHLIDETLASGAKSARVSLNAGADFLLQLPFLMKSVAVYTASQLIIALYNIVLWVRKTILKELLAKVIPWPGKAQGSKIQRICVDIGSWVRMVSELYQWISGLISKGSEALLEFFRGGIYTCWYLFILSFYDFIVGRLYLKVALYLFFKLQAYLKSRYQHHRPAASRGEFSLTALGKTIMDMAFWVLCAVGAYVLVSWILPALLPSDNLRDIDFFLVDVWESSITLALVAAAHCFLGLMSNLA